MYHIMVGYFEGLNFHGLGSYNDFVNLYFCGIYSNCLNTVYITCAWIRTPTKSTQKFENHKNLNHMVY